MKTNHDASVDVARRTPAASRSGPLSLKAGKGPMPFSALQLQAAFDRSPRMVAQRRAIDAAFGRAAQRQPDGRADEGLLRQGRLQGAAVQHMGDAGSGSTPAASSAATPVHENGMPSQLSAGIEALSGMQLSDVRVHRNSDKPAQLNALAYAQGNDIHLGPGQERHLPHEAWHVVQQRQGRVRETVQMAGVGVNDDVGLESEADLMGARALAQGAEVNANGPLQAQTAGGALRLSLENNPKNSIAQRAVAQMEDGDEDAPGGGRTGIMGDKLAGMIGEAFNILAVVPNYLPKEAQPITNIVAGTLLLGSAGYQYCTSKDGVEKIQALANASAAAAQLAQGGLQAMGQDGAATVVGFLPNLIWGTAEACNTFYNYKKYTATMVTAGGVKAIGALTNSVSAAANSDFAMYSTAAVAILGAAIAGGSHLAEMCKKEKPAADIDQGTQLNPAGDQLYGSADSSLIEIGS